MKKGMEKEENPLERVLRFVEKDRFGIIASVFILFTLAYLRSYLECRVFNYYSETLYLRSNHVALDIALFITGVVIISAISGINPRKVFNVVLFGWPIIITPPIIDFFLNAKESSNGYPYFSEPSLIKGMLLLFFTPSFMAQIGWGEIIQLWGIVILSSIYVLLRKRSVIRAFLTGLGLMTFISYIAVSMVNIIQIKKDTITLLYTFNFPIRTEYYSYLYSLVKPGEDPDFMGYAGFNMMQQLFLFVTLYYVIMFAASSIIFIYLTDRFYGKNRIKEFFSMSDPVFLTMVGILTVVGTWAGNVLYLEYVFHDIYLGFALIASLAAAQVWTMTGYLSAEKWEAKSFTRKQYRNVAVVLAILSLASAFVLFWGVFLITLVFLMTAFAYNCKPLKARTTSFAPFYFSLSGFFAFIIGFYTPTYWLVKVWGPHIKKYDPDMLRTIMIPVPHQLNMPSEALMALSAIAFIAYFFIKHREEFSHGTGNEKNNRKRRK